MSSNSDDKWARELVGRALPEQGVEPPAQRLWASIERELAAGASPNVAEASTERESGAAVPRPRHKPSRPTSRWAWLSAAALAACALTLLLWRLPTPELSTPGPASELERLLADYLAESELLEAQLASRSPRALAASAAALEALDSAYHDSWQALLEMPGSRHRAERALTYARWKSELLVELARHHAILPEEPS